ncbi:MAG: filamentous hemagglutinin N-terminal domain-containing protein [Magnetococcales bacterium]|nr:filamentous hemagglutinin N-terminal domain-containing protein [Magnetococcales bacterium]
MTSVRDCGMRVGIALLAVGCMGQPIPVTAASRIAFDGSLGSGGAVTGVQGVYAIDQARGTTRGNNLFHSFSRFSVGTGDTARFTGSGVSNIITRVTGGEMTTIDGRLESAIPGANLYLLNPHGVMFGRNASLNLSGSLHVATADYLAFPDGTRFPTDSARSVGLASVDPVAFGFLGGRAEGVTVRGAFLELPAGQGMTLIGGPVSLENATLFVESGRANLVATNGPGEVTLRAESVALQGFPALADVTLQRNEPFRSFWSGFGETWFYGDIGTSGTGPGQPGGQVFLTGDRVALTGSTIGNNNGADTSGGSVRIEASREMVLDGSGPNPGINGAVQNGTYAAGDAGSIQISAPRVVLKHGGSLSGHTKGRGMGSEITVTTQELILEEQAGIYANAFASGPGGRIAIHAERISMSGGSQINSFARGFGSGGEVVIQAHERLLIDGQSAEGAISGMHVTTRGFGQGGTLTLETPWLRLLHGGGLVATTSGAGHAGSLSVLAARLEMDGGMIQAETRSYGDAGQIMMDAGQMEMSNQSRISTTAQSSGQGGDVVMHISELVMRGASRIESSTQEQGSGGTIQIHAVRTRLEDESAIVANSTLPYALAGRAGSVQLRSSDTLIMNHGTISSSAESGGGGDLEIAVGQMIHLSDSALTTSVRGGDGNGGNIRVDPRFLILERTQVTANAYEGAGGNVHLQADTLIQDPATRITASSALGIQGTVVIDTPEINATEGLVAVNTGFFDASALMNQQCAARRSGKVSTLVVSTPGGLPEMPGDVRPAGIGQLSAHCATDLP